MLTPAAESLANAASVTGRTWRLRAADGEAVRRLCQRLQLPEMAARLLAARGVDAAAADDYLFPTLRRWLPDPLGLKDMDRAVDRLVAAIVGGERIAVLADYDVDGATGAALLLRFLGHLGIGTRLYVPDRLREGYGPSVPAMETLHGEGISLVVTIDCGVNAFAALERAATLGIDVVVVDHHQAPPVLPPARAVVNPNRSDEDGALHYLAAVGVTFLLVVAVNRALRQAGFYADRPEPDLKRWLDLVALGTVCDMVPLIALNRAFVRQGLAVATRAPNCGLAALASHLRLDGAASVHRLGFLFGPRINAGGRVGEADLGARLLATDDAGEATALAVRLDQFNQQRRAIEQAVVEAALDAADASDGLVWATGEDWHPGVLGIVANRLVDHFVKPAIVVSRCGGIATASARSVAGFDIGAAVKAASARGLLLSGGGHAMAAGFRCQPSLLAKVQRHFADAAAAAAANGATARRLDVDGLLTLAAITPEFTHLLEGCGPFGAGNPEPRFAFPDVTVEGVAAVGEGMLRLRLVDDSGRRRQGIVFGNGRHPLSRHLKDFGRGRCHLAARLRPPHAGRAVDLVIDDVATIAP